VRVVVGLEGSSRPTVAQHLIASLSWPPGTQFVFATAYARHGATTLTPRPELLDELDLLADPIRRAGHVVEVRVEPGPPGKLLCEIANEGAADLVVVGSRGHGAAASALLGSVSAELADHSPCPVLVARTPHISRVLVATDGSPSAAAIPRVLGRWRILHELPFDVVSVAPRTRANSDYLITAWAPAMEPADPAFEDPETIHQWRYVDAMIGELAEAGYSAAGLLRHGDPAHEIVAAASHMPDGLVITGSRGLGDLQRIMIGSVAHDVLLHSRCSVLVMRGHIPARLAERESVAMRSLSVS
jgi:nucleotide-binding universal stress UspA family protein